MRERYRIADLEARLWNETGTSCAKKSIERFTRIANVTAANESTGNMRTSNCASPRFLHDSIEIDIDAKPSESLDDVFCALLARIAKTREPMLEIVGLRDVKRQKMDLARTIVRAQLHSAHDTNSKWLRRELRFLKSRESIVICERNCGEAGSFRCFHYRRRRKRPVGCGRVHVKVDLTGLPGGLPGSHFL
jgi:hypothetical protein